MTEEIGQTGCFRNWGQDESVHAAEAGTKEAEEDWL